MKSFPSLSVQIQLIPISTHPFIHPSIPLASQCDNYPGQSYLSNKNSPQKRRRCDFIPKTKNKNHKKTRGELSNTLKPIISRKSRCWDTRKTIQGPFKWPRLSIQRIISQLVSPTCRSFHLPFSNFCLSSPPFSSSRRPGTASRPLRLRRRRHRRSRSLLRRPHDCRLLVFLLAAASATFPYREEEIPTPKIESGRRPRERKRSRSGLALQRRCDARAEDVRSGFLSARSPARCAVCSCCAGKPGWLWARHVGDGLRARGGEDRRGR